MELVTRTISTIYSPPEFAGSTYTEGLLLRYNMAWRVLTPKPTIYGVARVRPSQYGEVQGRRVYYFPSLSFNVDYSSATAGTSQYTQTLPLPSATPIAIGVSNVSLPPGAMLRSINVYSGTIYFNIYFSASTSGTVTYSALAIA